MPAIPAENILSPSIARKTVQKSEISKSKYWVFLKYSVGLGAMTNFLLSALFYRSVGTEVNVQIFAH